MTFKGRMTREVFWLCKSENRTDIDPRGELVKTVSLLRKMSRAAVKSFVNALRLLLTRAKSTQDAQPAR